MKKRLCKNPECFDFETGRPARLSRRQVKQKRAFCSRQCYGVFLRGRNVNGKNYVRIRIKIDCPKCLRQPGFFADCVRCKGTGEISTRVYLHRWKMAQRLGRELQPTEIVHHIDHNPFNNDDDNLQLFASNWLHLEYHRANPFPPGKAEEMKREQESELDFWMKAARERPANNYLM